MVMVPNCPGLWEPSKPCKPETGFLGSQSKIDFSVKNLEAELQRPEIVLPFKPMVVAKVKGVVSHSSGEDVWKGADLPAEDATEGGKAPKPEEPRTFGVNPVEQEQKAEDLGPKDPPAENAWVDDTLGDEEPEGETAPPDRKRAAMPGIVSRPSGEDVWKGRTVKDEGATEGGTPLKPDEPLDHDLQVGLEEKAESFGPTDPPDDNTWIKDSDADDEPEGSIAPPVRRHAAMTGVAGPLFEAPTITDPIGGPVLCLGPPGLEPASAPELPLAHPKVPSPPECPGITQISKLVTPDASTHHTVDPIIDFVGEEKGHQDGGTAGPGILQALKLIDELVISYGGLEVPKPQRPKTPPPKGRAIMAF